MRILTVSHFFESHGGGIERVAGHLCRQFAKLGASAAWAASDADPAPTDDIDVVRLPCINPTEKLTGLPMPIPGAHGIQRLSREIRSSDALVIHDALYVTSILAMMMAKARGKRVILIQHIAGIPFSSPVLRRMMSVANLLVTRPMLRAADVRVFISAMVRDELLGSPPRHPSELLFNGVDGSIFHPVEPDPLKPDSVAQIEPSATGRRVMFVGRYVEKKGLNVVRALAETRPDLTFFLVGGGPIQPKASWKLANVHDLGPRTPQEIAELYRWTDLLLLPSVGEGYPLVIQEAMACGLPVLCGEPTDRADPDAARWIRGVEIDLSRPQESARRCSVTIDGLALADSERAEMASYALSRYDWRAMAGRLLELAQTSRAGAA